MLLSHLPSAADPPRLSQDIDTSSCSTPFVSAPSSPAHSAYFYSAPPTPMHFDQINSAYNRPVFLTSDSGSFEFEFSSRFSPTGNLPNASMTSADELFFNGQIRPMKQWSQLHSGGGDLKFSHRKARSMSPAVEYEWRGFSFTAGEQAKRINESAETTPSCSASTSRSSSSGRSSKKWMFLKDLLHRSKSEGRGNRKERFWSISFSPANERKGRAETKRGTATGKPANGVWRRRVPAPSAHELHYTANRAQAEEMKKKTFLPYRQGLLGCLGFSSKSYVAFTGSFLTNRNPISSI